MLLGPEKGEKKIKSNYNYSKAGLLSYFFFNWITALGTLK